MTFGEKLYKLRKANRYSQDMLANKLLVTRQAVSKWELGEMLPDYENVVKIAKLFSVSTDCLLKNDIEIEKQSKRIIPAFLHSFEGVDLASAIAALAGAVVGWVYYIYRLLWQYYTYDENITPARDPIFNIYKDRIWYETVDEYVIISVLFILIVFFGFRVFSIYRKLKSKINSK
ncbi:MAG: helix-turn-helix transcriptional regulator [Oscillospiraceae bacterium]|nr:helix-turn-helix transcriptional regulator [Oscillospiraceae bacterium]